MASRIAGGFIDVAWSRLGSRGAAGAGSNHASARRPNRSYTVQLACVEVAEAQQAEAVTWLRQAVPRHTRVNLRPMGQNQGVLLARVQPLAPGRGSKSQSTDLGSGLIAAGLAQADLLTTADCAK